MCGEIKAIMFDLDNTLINEYFSIEPEEVNAIIKLQEHMKTAIITNGPAELQSAKIKQTGLIRTDLKMKQT